MKITLITNPYNITGETDTINHLFDLGLEELHLRKPNYDKDEIIRYIDRINPAYHHLINLHSCYSLVHQYPIHRIHLDRDSRKNYFGRWMMDHFILKGKAVNRTASVGSYKALYHLDEKLDEVILGPVFSNSSLTQATQLIKSESLKRAISQCPIPVTASGGINVQNASFFAEVGFEGMALQSAIWKNPDPISIFLEIKDVVRPYMTLRKAL